jgi:nickel/cobalt transporter (NicO) family protein
VKRLFIAVAGVMAFLLAPSAALAHPLGNFTVNHFARIEPRLDGVRIDYVLDEAEIPTFQDKPQLDAGPDTFAEARAAAIGSNLHLTVGGQPLALHLDSQSVTLGEGAGGLPTLRLEATFSAAYDRVIQPVQLTLGDDNEATRIGWREIIAAPSDVLQRSSVPTTDVTDALRTYPDDLLNSPLNVRSAELTLAPALVGTAVRLGGTSLAMPLATGPAAVVMERARSAFADLANADELTPALVIFAVGVALVLGAAHALQPGHGKTVVAAYLVGSRGTPRHALFLGFTVTATHTAGVYALGLVTLGLSQYIVPERLYPFLEVGSGLVVVLIGAWLFGQRLLAAVGLRHGHQHDHDHGHEHAAGDHSGEDHSMEVTRGRDITSGRDITPGQEVRAIREGHHHERGHHHHHDDAQPSERVGWRSLLALGVSGGLLPCPEALMVLLITIAAHRVLFGLLLIVAFSTGLAAVLVGFGLLLVYARQRFQRLNLSHTALIPRALPVASALVIVLAGSLITLQALPQVL